MTKTEWVKIKHIELHNDLQPRAEPPPGAVEEYAELINTQVEKDPDNPWPFHQPVVLYTVGGAKFLTSGWTRLNAAKHVGMDIVYAEVRKGNWLDAVTHACGANCDHGYRRTKKDKRRAVEILIRHVSNENESWSDSRIAEECYVSTPFVASIRSVMQASGEVPESTTRVAKDGKKHTSAGSGRKTKQTQEPTEADQPEQESGSEYRYVSLQEPCPICGKDVWELHDDGYQCVSCIPSDTTDTSEQVQSSPHDTPGDWEDADGGGVAVDVQRSVVDGKTLERARKALSTLSRAVGSMGLPLDAELRKIHEHLQRCDPDE